MHTRTRFPLLAVTVLALSVLACDIPTPPPATLPPLPPTVTPFTPPTTLPTEAPPTAPPTEPPTEPPPPSSWLPPGTIALYTSGPWAGPRLHALAADGATTDLGRDVHSRTAASRTGRWIAHPTSSPPASSITIVNLENGTTYTIPTTPGFEPYGIAFDLAETRLACLEMGPLGTEGAPWAIIVVSLADGSTARFEALMGPDRERLPGSPIGWTTSGSELLLDTFMPYTEGNWGGVLGIALPPGAGPAPIATLGSRELVPGGGYLAPPRLSPSGAQLLHLNRDFDYIPAGYEVMAYDLAVNQLWTADLASSARTLLVDATDGSALASDAAWSPDGAQILFARGNYAGDTFASLMLKIRDNSGAIRDIGPAPLPPGGGLQSLDWCRPGIGLVTVTTADYDHQLHRVDLASGGTTLLLSAESIAVVGCIP